MSASKETVSEKLLALLNPTPVHLDPEADIYEETTAKVVDKDPVDDDFTDDESLSVFRKQNASLIEESDERYKGKKISRQKIEGSTWEESNIDKDEDLDDEESAEDAESASDDDVATLSDSESSSEGGEDLSGMDIDDSAVDLDTSSARDDAAFQHIAQQNVGAEVEKGTAIRNQLNSCDSLLESRIQLQKSLVAANRFPRLDVLSEFQTEGGNQFSSAIEQTKQSVASLLNKLLELRSEKLKLFSETRNIGQETESSQASDDENITSSSEDDDEEQVSDKKIIPNPKKRKLEDYSVLLDKHHTEFLDYRNGTLQKWNDKTRVALGKVNSRNFTAFEQSTVRQIEQTMVNRQRLIGRTQLKRTSYRVLGKAAVAESQSSQAVMDTESMEDKSKVFDLEIFDDDDFYHQLLRELIERRAADVTDPMRLGRQWLELQKVRSKMKRKIDTRATKGRKIRYTTHAKLVNFMAPVAEIAWNNEARVELYNSLFGKTWDDLKGNVKKVRENERRMLQTGGGSPLPLLELNNVEQRVAALLGEVLLRGIAGVEEGGEDSEEDDRLVESSEVWQDVLIDPITNYICERTLPETPVAGTSAGRPEKRPAQREIQSGSQAYHLPTLPTTKRRRSTVSASVSVEDELAASHKDMASANLEMAKSLGEMVGIMRQSAEMNIALMSEAVAALNSHARSMEVIAQHLSK